MAEAANLALVKRFYAALEGDDLDSVARMCAQQIEWVYPNVREVPYCRTWLGVEGVMAFLASHDEEEEILEFRQTDFIAQGDRMAVLGSFRGRVKATGRVWETNFVHVATVGQGQVQRFEAYFDTAAAVEARR